MALHCLHVIGLESEGRRYELVFVTARIATNPVIEDDPDPTVKLPAFAGRLEEARCLYADGVILALRRESAGNLDVTLLARQLHRCGERMEEMLRLLTGTFDRARATYDRVEPQGARQWFSCSWCHHLNSRTRRYCENCGHAAHKPRLECNCPRCNDLRQASEADATNQADPSRG